MTASPEDESLAAEYALGVLDAGERAVVSARRMREPQLDAAILAWEGRLAPLLELVPVSWEGPGVDRRVATSGVVVATALEDRAGRLAPWTASTAASAVRSAPRPAASLGA